MDEEKQSILTMKGQKLSLRPSRGSDAEVLFPWVHERPDVLNWVCWSGPTSLEEYRGKLEHPTSGQAPRQDHTLTIEAHQPGGVRVPAGTLDLSFAAQAASGDIGYWIAEPFRGRGLATEAIALAAKLAFESCGATGLVAAVFVGNEPSRRVLEANGFRLVQTIRGLHRTRGSSNAASGSSEGIGSTEETSCGSKAIDEWQFCLLKTAWSRRLKSASQGAQSESNSTLAGSPELPRDPTPTAD